MSTTISENYRLLKTKRIILPKNAATGRILRSSDASGNVQWVDDNGGGGGGGGGLGEKVYQYSTLLVARNLDGVFSVVADNVNTFATIGGAVAKATELFVAAGDPDLRITVLVRPGEYNTEVGNAITVPHYVMLRSTTTDSAGAQISASAQSEVLVRAKMIFNDAQASVDTVVEGLRISPAAGAAIELTSAAKTNVVLRNCHVECVAGASSAIEINSFAPAIGGTAYESTLPYTGALLLKNTRIDSGGVAKAITFQSTGGAGYSLMRATTCVINGPIGSSPTTKIAVCVLEKKCVWKDVLQASSFQSTAPVFIARNSRIENVSLSSASNYLFDTCEILGSDFTITSALGVAEFENCKLVGVGVYNSGNGSANSQLNISRCRMETCAFFNVQCNVSVNNSTAVTLFNDPWTFSGNYTIEMNNTSFTYANGGADTFALVCNSGNFNLKLNACVFSSTNAAGCIRVLNSAGSLTEASISITNSTLECENGLALRVGDAAASQSLYPVTLTNSTFKGGAGILVNTKGAANVSECTFSDSTACTFSATPLHLSNSTFDQTAFVLRNNFTVADLFDASLGGCVFENDSFTLDFSNQSTGSASSVSITDCNFNNYDIATSGAAVALSQLSVSLTGTTLVNSALTVSEASAQSALLTLRNVSAQCPSVGVTLSTPQLTWNSYNSVLQFSNLSISSITDCAFMADGVVFDLGSPTTWGVTNDIVFVARNTSYNAQIQFGVVAAAGALAVFDVSNCTFTQNLFLYRLNGSSQSTDDLQITIANSNVAGLYADCTQGCVVNALNSSFDGPFTVELNGLGTCQTSMKNCYMKGSVFINCISGILDVELDNVSVSLTTNITSDNPAVVTNKVSFYNSDFKDDLTINADNLQSMVLHNNKVVGNFLVIFPKSHLSSTVTCNSFEEGVRFFLSGTTDLSYTFSQNVFLPLRANLSPAGATIRFQSTPELIAPFVTGIKLFNNVIKTANGTEEWIENTTLTSSAITVKAYRNEIYGASTPPANITFEPTILTPPSTFNAFTQ